MAEILQLHAAHQEHKNIETLAKTCMFVFISLHFEVLKFTGNYYLNPNVKYEQKL